MRQLVAAFAGDIPEVAQLPWLDNFSARHWDFRGGKERNLARSAELSRLQQSLVLDLAQDLGLAGQETPTRVEYDTVLMTGAAWCERGS